LKCLKNQCCNWWYFRLIGWQRKRGQMPEDGACWALRHANKCRNTDGANRSRFGQHVPDKTFFSFSKSHLVLINGKSPPQTERYLSQIIASACRNKGLNPLTRFPQAFYLVRLYHQRNPNASGNHAGCAIKRVGGFRPLRPDLRHSAHADEDERDFHGYLWNQRPFLISHYSFPERGLTNLWLHIMLECTKAKVSMTCGINLHSHYSYNLSHEHYRRPALKVQLLASVLPL
jgi:hypothetical protein